MFVDLHIHTFFSDGTMSPEDVAYIARQNDIGLIAVTDHNNIRAIDRLQEACRGNGIKTISAVEIDVMQHDKYLHLLAYGFDVTNAAFSTLIRECNDKMSYGNDALINNMAQVNPNIDIEEYKNYKYSLTRGGHKHSNYLIDKGLIDTHREVFPLFNKYGIPLVDLELPQLEVVCNLVHIAGGKAILAHPWSNLGRENFTNDLNEVKQAGIDGIECFYPSHSNEITSACVAFCKKNDFLITAGSDAHGAFNNRNIGSFKIDIRDLNLVGLIEL